MIFVPSLHRMQTRFGCHGRSGCFVFGGRIFCYDYRCVVNLGRRRVYSFRNASHNSSNNNNIITRNVACRTQRVTRNFWAVPRIYYVAECRIVGVHGIPTHTFSSRIVKNVNSFLNSPAFDCYIETGWNRYTSVATLCIFHI